MSRCKKCKYKINKKGKFCTNCGQPVEKKKIPLPVIPVMIALVLVLIGIFIWTHRIDISVWTGGKLFGYRASELSLEEMQSEILPPSEDETKEFLAYVERLQSYGERKMSRDEKIAYQELNALFVMLTDCAEGDLTLSLDTIQEEFDARLKEVKKQQSFLGGLFSNMSLTVNAAESLSQEDYITDSSAYLASMLKNSASSLFLQGNKDLALALASMATSLTPHDSSMANLMGNILKEYGLTDTSYEMLHYALRVNPNDEVVLHTLGMLCIDMGNYEEAEYCFNRMLTMSGGKGPANQGWMLLALAEGDLPSAYLYMLEGAREGYTHTVTEVYEAFRMRNDYFDIAGPIFDQYPLYELVKFERTQQVFDATLDTIEQQVVIDRELKVCHDAGGAMIAQAENILESKRYAEEMAALMVSNLVNYLSTYQNEFAELESLLADPDLAKLMEGDFSSLWSLGEKYALPEEQENVYTYSYEQEVFFLNILQDYLEYNLDKNEEKYMNAAINKLDIELQDGPLEGYVTTWKEFCVEMEDVFSECMKLEEMGSDDPIAWLIAGIEPLMTMNHNFESNGHGLWDAEFTTEQFANLNEAVKDIYPLLEEGYKEQAILCEEYYLYTNNILGYIADDKIYNEWRYYQQLNVQFALIYYPMGGFFYNEMLSGLATMTWGSAAPIGDADIHIPDTPVFPVTGMGTPTGEPVIIWEYEPPPANAISLAADMLWGDAVKTDPTFLEGREEGETSTIEPPYLEEDGFTEYIEPEICISIDPENDKPAEATTITEEVSSPAKLKYKLGKIVNLTIDPLTGEIAFGAGVMLGSGKIKLNLSTGDVTLYGHVGPEVGADFAIGTVGVDYGELKAGGYAKLVLNVSEGEITAAEIGADVGAEVVGFGVEAAVGYDFATGVKRDTASSIISGIKTTRGAPVEE